MNFSRPVPMAPAWLAAAFFFAGIPAASALDPTMGAASLPRGLPGLLAGQMDGMAAPAPSVDAAYRPDPDVRRRLADIMADAAARQGQREAEEMRALVLSGEAVRQYERAAPQLGYHAHDAIDGLAFYLLAQWGVANDHRPAITPAQAAGVRRQAARAFAGVAGQVDTDALRQEFGEMLMIQGAIMAGVHEAALRAGDEAALARYAAMARKGGRALFQADPADVALTDDGFRRK